MDRRQFFKDLIKYGIWGCATIYGLTCVKKAMGWGAQSAMMGGMVAAGGGDPPPSGTVVLGLYDTTTDNYWYVESGAGIYAPENPGSPPSALVAAWAATDPTTTVNTAQMYTRTGSGGACNAKFVIHTADDNVLVGVSNAAAISDTSNAWVTFTFGTPPTITKGVTYCIGIVTDTANSPRFNYNSAGAGAKWIHDGDMSYASPGNIVGSTDYVTSLTVACMCVKV